MKCHTFILQQDDNFSNLPQSDLDSENTVVFLFSDSTTVQQSNLIEEIIQQFPTSHVIGCSGAGLIHQSSLYDNSVSVGIIRFEHSSLRSAHAPTRSSEDSFEAGVQIANQLDSPALKHVFVLIDGLNTNGSEFLRGINSKLSNEISITGGMSCDNDFESTWVIKDGQPQTGVASAIGIYGDRINIEHGSKGGWDVFGLERRISKAEGNILYELDDKPALDLYEEYLGDLAAELPRSGLLFPLAIRSDLDANKTIVRTIIGIDRNDRSLTFAGDIPQGHMAQLMKTNFERVITGASDSALLIDADREDQSDKLCIAVSCIGRRLVLGERTEEEIEAVSDVLPPNTQTIGFYSLGEISPYVNGDCDLQNQTMTLTLISER